MKKLISIITILSLFNIVIYAHSGGTNSDGCHTNRKTGEYHCHKPKRQSVYKQSDKQQIYETSSSNGYDCSRKYCTQMSSCQEAQYKFNVCKHYRLDGDNDGIPCENICGH